MNAPQDQAGRSETAAGPQSVDAAAEQVEDTVVGDEVVEDEVVEDEVVEDEVVKDEVVDGELVDDEASDPGVDADDADDAVTDEAVPSDAAAEPAQHDAAQADAEGDHPADQPAGAGSAADEPAPVPAGTAVTSTPLPDLVPPAPSIPFDYTDAGVPTMDYVRDKIEGRYGTALGSTELAEATGAAEQQRNAVAERERLAKEKLAELRKQVDGDSAGSPAG